MLTTYTLVLDDPVNSPRSINTWPHTSSFIKWVKNSFIRWKIFVPRCFIQLLKVWNSWNLKCFFDPYFSFVPESRTPKVSASAFLNNINDKISLKDADTKERLRVIEAVRFRRMATRNKRHAWTPTLAHSCTHSHSLAHPGTPLHTLPHPLTPLHTLALANTCARSHRLTHMSMHVRIQFIDISFKSNDVRMGTHAELFI